MKASGTQRRDGQRTRHRGDVCVGLHFAGTARDQNFAHVIAKIRDELAALVEAGCGELTVDEPSMSCYAYKEDRRRLVDLFNRTFADDEAQLVKVMRGLQSRAYESSVLAKPDLEGTIWDFYNYLAANLTH